MAFGEVSCINLLIMNCLVVNGDAENVYRMATKWMLLCVIWL